MAFTSGLNLLGVSLSGGEYGTPTAQNPGRLYYDYALPSNSELEYYAGKGMDVIRLPFLWERMQPVLNGALNPDFLQQVDQVVAAANARGLSVDLDLHNYGSYAGQMVGSEAVPGSSLADVWSRLAAHYSGANVMFGLMNEPSIRPDSWAGIAQSAIQAIRATGATQEILVPGGQGGTASSFVGSGNAAALTGAISDPGHNMAYEVHEYLDPNESGTSTAVVSPTIGAERLASVTQWAEATGNRLFLGEFGASSDAAGLKGLDTMLSAMAQHADVWQGGTYWAGGPWWGGYPFSVEPANGVDKPQVAVLAKFEHVALETMIAPAAAQADPGASNSVSLRDVPAAPVPETLPGFDAAFYLAHNPDVAQAGVDPQQHFLVSGWHEGRNPDAVFDTSYYLQQNPDVKAAAIDPLLHFLAYGSHEGRAPSLIFDPAAYLRANPDVAAAGVNPLSHFVASGQGEHRATFLTGSTAPADPLIDTAAYDRQLGATIIPDGVAGAEQASASYHAGGWKAGLNPDTWFDTNFYLQQNPDVAAAHVDPLLHYEQSGWMEGRDPSAAFSTNGYLAAHTDVAAAGLDPLLHYMVFGLAEGRSIVPAS